MNEIPECKVPKWPYLLGNALLLAIAATIIYEARHPISETVQILACASVALGAILGCVPFYLDYRATVKLIDVNAVTTVADQLHDLRKYSAQIAAATDQWSRVQDATKGHADKTVSAAAAIAERMANEISEFNEFQAKLNDTEKGALRLEVEKLRRSEGEWLQVLVRILDHIFSLYTAATRSGQPELAEPIANFQNACRDAARRVGLTPFGAEPNEKFDSKRHRAKGVENPVDGTPITGLIALGISYQGRLVRPALVRLAGENEPAAAPGAAKAPATEPAPEAQVENPPESEPTAEAASDQLTLETDEV